MAEETEKLVNGDGIAAWTEILEANPKAQKGLSSKLIYWLEKFIVKLLCDSSYPQHYLSGDYAPAPNETPPTKDLLVKGHLPECLNSEFERVGPKPEFVPVAAYHWFTGDGWRIREVLLREL